MFKRQKTEVVTYEWCNTAYFVMAASDFQAAPIEVEELLICYDPSAEQVFYSELADDSAEMKLFLDGAIVWEDSYKKKGFSIKICGMVM